MRFLVAKGRENCGERSKGTQLAEVEGEEFEGVDKVNLRDSGQGKVRRRELENVAELEKNREVRVIHSRRST